MCKTFSAWPGDPNLLEGALADAAVGSVAGFTPKLVACLLDGLTLAGAVLSSES